MADLVLHHCVPVLVGGPYVPPVPVTIGFSIGGSDGDGTVDVSAPQLAGPISVPTNSSGYLSIQAVSAVTVHYRKTEGGPSEIPAKITVTR